MFEASAFPTRVRRQAALALKQVDEVMKKTGDGEVPLPWKRPRRAVDAYRYGWLGEFVVLFPCSLSTGLLALQIQVF